MIYAQYNITYRHSIDVVWKQLKTYSSKSWKLTDFPLTRICPQNTILFFFRTVLFNCILRFEEPTPPSTAIYPYEGNTEEVDFSKQHENNKQKHNQNRFTKKKDWLEESQKNKTQNPDFLVFSLLFGFLVFFFFPVCFGFVFFL